jgi:hypothetical protein
MGRAIPLQELETQKYMEWGRKLLKKLGPVEKLLVCYEATGRLVMCSMRPAGLFGQPFREWFCRIDTDNSAWRRCEDTHKSNYVTDADRISGIIIESRYSLLVTA